MEKWNAYTRDGRLTDTVLYRGEPIPAGLYHVACEILIRHTDGDYLLMKRSVLKRDYGGMYETGAGGAMQYGEEPTECAVREMKEETGLDAGELIHINTKISDESQMIVHSYLTVVDCPKDSVTLQYGETEGYKWVNEKEFIEFINSDGMIAHSRKRLENYFRSLGYIK